MFIDAYRADVRDQTDLAPLTPLYLLRNRLMLWRYFVGGDPRPAWSRGKTFRGWAEPYLSRMLSLL